MFQILLKTPGTIFNFKIQIPADTKSKFNIYIIYVCVNTHMNIKNHFVYILKLGLSATMTDAPIILTLDSDMFSNDPQTPLRVLCYLLDPSMDSKLEYIQFPQIFDGINKNDIYGGKHKLAYQIQTKGMHGLADPIYVGTGCFFRRRVLFGGPSEIPKLNQDHRAASESIKSEEVLTMAHHVAGCTYEKETT